MLLWLQQLLGNLRLVLPCTERLNTFEVLTASLRYPLCDYENRIRRFSVVTCWILNVKKEKKKLLGMWGALGYRGSPFRLRGNWIKRREGNISGRLLRMFWRGESGRGQYIWVGLCNDFMHFIYIYIWDWTTKFCSLGGFGGIQTCVNGRTDNMLRISLISQKTWKKRCLTTDATNIMKIMCD